MPLVTLNSGYGKTLGDFLFEFYQEAITSPNTLTGIPLQETSVEIVSGDALPTSITLSIRFDDGTIITESNLQDFLTKFLEEIQRGNIISKNLQYFIESMPNLGLYGPYLIQYEDNAEP